MEPPPSLPPETHLLSDRQVPEHFLLFLGRASPDKGALDAAKAVLQLQASGLDLHLVLAGTVSADFRRFYDRLPALPRQRLHLLGPVSEAEKHALLSACLGLTLPSRVDALGLVLLEAWWHEKPVVAAEAGGIPGIVTDGQSGLLVPYGDVPALAEAFARLARDPTLRQALGRQGRQRLLSEFTWDKVAQRAEVEYQAAIEGTWGQ
jgi:glycosyltransferase involved in cell wall biosynthesis